MRDKVFYFGFLLIASGLDAVSTMTVIPNTDVEEASPVIAAFIHHLSGSHATLATAAFGVVLPWLIYVYLVRVNDHIFATYFITSSIASQTLAAINNLAIPHHGFNSILFGLSYAIGIAGPLTGMVKQARHEKKKKQEKLKQLQQLPLPEDDF